MADWGPGANGIIAPSIPDSITLWMEGAGLNSLRCSRWLEMAWATTDDDIAAGGTT